MTLTKLTSLRLIGCKQITRQIALSTVTVIFASFAYVVSAPPSSILRPPRWHYPSPTAGDQILHGSRIEFLGRQKFPINRMVALIICHLRDPLASQRSVQLFSAFCFTFSPSSSSTHTPTLTPQQTPPSSSPQLMKQFLISCSLPEEIK